MQFQVLFSYDIYNLLTIHMYLIHKMYSWNVQKQQWISWIWHKKNGSFEEENSKCEIIHNTCNYKIILLVGIDGFLFFKE